MEVAVLYWDERLEQAPFDSSFDDVSPGDDALGHGVILDDRPHFVRRRAILGYLQYNLSVAALRRVSLLGVMPHDVVTHVMTRPKCAPFGCVSRGTARCHDQDLPALRAPRPVRFS